MSSLLERSSISVTSIGMRLLYFLSIRPPALFTSSTHSR